MWCVSRATQGSRSWSERIVGRINNLGWEWRHIFFPGAVATAGGASGMDIGPSAKTAVQPKPPLAPDMPHSRYFLESMWKRIPMYRPRPTQNRSPLAW